MSRQDAGQREEASGNTAQRNTSHEEAASESTALMQLSQEELISEKIHEEAHPVSDNVILSQDCSPH